MSTVRLLAGAAALILTVVVIPVWTAAAQMEVPPGSAARGAEVFAAKGCAGCHGLDGVGGTTAPDLGRGAAARLAPGGLARAMWNHGPRMWEDMRAAGMAVPSMTTAEAADLFSFFYARWRFSGPGDAEAGRRVFADNNCIVCHALDGRFETDRIGPPVSDWDYVRNPIEWAGRMWNHAEDMFEQMERAALRWPRFNPAQMMDLLVYLEDLPEAASAPAGFEPGEAERGRAVFTTHCESCHSFGPSLPGRIDLLRPAAPPDMVGYAAAMWNHAPLMQARDGGVFRPLADGAMNDLIAYLFTERQFSAGGSVAAGALVYGAKQCGFCHEVERAAIGAPDLALQAERYSSITMTSAFWNHGPQMLATLEDAGFGWPVFQGTEMDDLIAFLNSRLAAQVAR